MLGIFSCVEKVYTLSALVPSVTPTPLFSYQEDGAHLMASWSRGGNLDSPGVGKTCQTIRAIDLRRMRRGVVICPAHLRENWLKEFRKFGFFERRICKGTTLHDFVAWSRGVFDVLVLSFEMATKWADKFNELADIIEFIVIDEFHYLNSLETKRAKAILGRDGDGKGGLIQWALQSWALTGTLMSNDPAQSYTYLRFTGAIDMPYATFVRRYFTSRASTWGQRNKPKPEHVAELQEMIGRRSIRRTLESVGHQLPDIFLTTVLVEGNTTELRALLSAHPDLDEVIHKALADDDVAPGEDWDLGAKLKEHAAHIATLRRLIAEAKALPYAEMLLDEMAADPERKIVVMGNSREALITVQRQLTAKGAWCVLVMGGVSETARIDAVSAFQSNPKCRVFVGNMRSAGTGLTLTAAAHIDILESDWTPAANDQAIKRIRRIGQKQVQHARFITLARSLDEMVQKVVAEKTRAIAMIEGDAMLTTAGD